MKVRAFQPLPPNTRFAEGVEIMAAGAPVKDRHGDVIGRVISATTVEGGYEVVMDIGIEEIGE